MRKNEKEEIKEGMRVGREKGQTEEEGDVLKKGRRNGGEKPKQRK